VTHSVTATASNGGTITPSGVVTVNEGASIDFTILSQAGYRIDEVTIDGLPIGTVSTHEFTNVTGDHTINVTFTPVPVYTILVSSSAGGTISPSGSVSGPGGTCATFSITPSNGYVIAGVTVAPSATYTFSSVNSSHTIAAAFSIISSVVYKINCGSNSSATPYSADQFSRGGTQRTVTNSISMGGLTDPAPQAVYQSERYGNSTYTIPGLVASENYLVRLHFTELYWTAAGKRVFDEVLPFNSLNN
jgi:hypothetical protein